MPRFFLFFIAIFVSSLANVPGSRLVAQTSAAQVEFTKCWQFAEPESEIVALSADSRAVFASTSDARITSVALTTGEKLWSTEVGGSIASNLLTFGDRLYLVAHRGNSPGDQASLKSLAKETGILAKDLPIQRGERYYVESDASGIIVVSSSGDVYLVSAGGDHILWHRKPTGSVVGKPYINGGTIVLSSSDRNLIRLSVKTGEIDFIKQLPNAPSVVFSSRSGDLFYGDSRGDLSSVTERWTLKLGAQVSELFELDGTLIVSSYDNFLYRISPRNGDVKWRKRLAGRIAGTSLAPDKSLLVFILGDSTALLLEPKRGRTVGQIALGAPIEAAVIPRTFDGGSIVSLNGDVLAFANGSCHAKKAPAVTARALPNPK